MVINNERRKTIAIDMDEVIADFQKKHLDLYNHEYDEVLTLEDLQCTRLWQIRPQLKDEILAYVDDPGFFRDLEVMEASQEVIKELSQDFEIFITTAAMEHPSSFSAKYEWLKEHFPFISDLNFVFCGNKSIIDADYLIDDSPRHFKGFRGKGLLFTAPHNVEISSFKRVNDWQEVREYFLR
ncbi:5'-3'-deoxyribonucleotidase [Bacillus sp. BHET2]|uniref:5' nucleotidase, NT5C type n=1 Tax=Bacillus sp. BHET2 TaxID=2583818 RepID=UPI00110D3775|nr:5'-3'-deoxyribonucleotidase [Bacillus sp. BHET2]TMU87021.1 5'-3'-deoxyribonucleotidase [Bacillus sp. BHET2]